MPHSPESSPRPGPTGGRRRLLSGRIVALGLMIALALLTLLMYAMTHPANLPTMYFLPQ